MKKKWIITLCLSIISVAIVCVVVFTTIYSSPQENLKSVLNFLFTMPVEDIELYKEKYMQKSDQPRPFSEDDITTMDIYEMVFNDNIGNYLNETGLRSLVGTWTAYSWELDDMNAKYTSTIDQINITQYDETTYYFTSKWHIYDGEQPIH